MLITLYLPDFADCHQILSAICICFQVVLRTDSTELLNDITWLYLVYILSTEQAA